MHCCPDTWFQVQNKECDLEYDLEGWNCQSVATSLAVVICDDGFGAWDNIEHLSFFNNTGMSYSLEILELYYGLRWFEPRLFIRGVRCWMKNYVTEVATKEDRVLSKEEAMNQAIAGFNKGMVEIHRQLCSH